MAAQFQSAPGPSRPHILPNFPTPGMGPISTHPSPGRPEPPGAYPSPTFTTTNNYPFPSPPRQPTMDMPSPTVAGVRREDSSAKRNPFVDLIETEKVYVEQLTLVIRRVAAAWSRRNLPPPKLDAMFRCVEAVYRANRAFGVRLKEIGPNPSDPKSLGDLLMRWIDDLEPAYGRYATIFLAGFDNYPPVASNTLLPPILDEVSVTSPPNPPLQHWSLDALFLLPYARLRYYRKLYSRLLQNTVEGRSDHKLLATACQRLETLVDEVEDRLETDVTEEETPVPSSAGDDESKDSAWPNEKGRTSGTSSGPDSSIESQSVLSSFNSRMDSTRNSQTSAATSITHSPGHAPKIAVPPLTIPSQSVNDLELRIDCSRTIDLFTMKLRKCKLHMNPPNLSYQRQIRSSHDVIIYFTPTSTGEQVVHQRAHIFILTDLFLVADRMEAAEKAEMAQQVASQQPDRLGEGSPMPEMWLSYPPLAGKHLSVVEGQQSNVIAVTVMRKETFVIHAESEIERDLIMKSLQECIEFATFASQRTSPLPSPVDGKSRSPMSPGSAMGYPSPMSPMTQTMSPDSSITNLSVPMGNMQLESGKTAQWNQSPPMNQMPYQHPGAPQPQPQSNGLPLRGASLKYSNGRGPSPQSMPGGPPPMPPPQQRSMTMPMSSMSEPGMPDNGSMRGLSMHSTGSRESGPMSQSAASSPRMPNHPGPFPAMRQPMPQMARQAYGPGPMRTDLPPVPQVHNGSHHSDSGLPDRQSYPERYMNGVPPMPQGPPRARSAEPFREMDAMRPPDKPSARFGAIRSESPVNGASPMPMHPDDSPPPSPTLEEAPTIRGPTSITAQMKCKVFLQQGHGQWKSMGHAKLKLYVEKERKIKQLVVETDGRSAQTLISTIVLTDGVERVGKTGVAVEVSDRGQHTGIIYMIQLRNESSAGGLYESLLADSDRAR